MEKTLKQENEKVIQSLITKEIVIQFKSFSFRFILNDSTIFFLVNFNQMPTENLFNLNLIFIVNLN